LNEVLVKFHALEAHYLDKCVSIRLTFELQSMLLCMYTKPYKSWWGI